VVPLTRAALILRNAAAVNRQRSTSSSPAKENRRSGRVRLASRHLFGDDYLTQSPWKRVRKVCYTNMVHSN